MGEEEKRGTDGAGQGQSTGRQAVLRVFVVCEGAKRKHVVREWRLVSQRVVRRPAATAAAGASKT